MCCSSTIITKQKQYIGIRAAPLWDASKHRFIGMLTITDFIHILLTYYHSPQLKMEELQEHTLDNWRSMLCFHFSLFFFHLNIFFFLLFFF